SVPLQTVLLSTALLDRFNPALCGTLVEQADAQRTLEQLEQDQLFLVPLDEPAGWYRSHRLFALTMRGYLQRSQPDLAGSPIGEPASGLSNTTSWRRPSLTVWRPMIVCVLRR